MQDTALQFLQMGIKAEWTFIPTFFHQGNEPELVRKKVRYYPDFPISIVIATPSTSHSFTDVKRAGSGCAPSFENPKNLARTSSAIITIISSVWSRASTRL